MGGGRGGGGEGRRGRREGEGDSIAIYNQCTALSYNILCCDKQFYHPLVLLKLTAFVSCMATIVNLRAWPSCSHGNAARWVGFNGHPYSRQTMCVGGCGELRRRELTVAAAYIPRSWR